MSEVKGMYADVYFNPAYRSCALGGISEIKDRVVVIGAGIPERVAADHTEALIIVDDFCRGKPRRRAVPPNSSGLMFSGNYVEHPITREMIKVHDRSERRCYHTDEFLARCQCGRCQE